MNCPACGTPNVNEAILCAACGVQQGRSVWADDTRCVVYISFDIDGPSGMMNRNPEVEHKISTMSMGEYGPRVGAPRILDLFAKYGLATSFYIPGWVAERHPKLLERIVADGHEVGHHGYMHEPPATLSRDEEAAVLDHGIEIISGITGSPPLGYRSPSWELTEHSLRLMAERGIVYDSSLMADDVPYFVGEPDQRLVELPIHWSMDDYPHFGFFPGDPNRLMASPDHVFNVFASAFEDQYERGGLFALTLHPYISGRPGRLTVVERLIKHIQGFAGVRFMRGIDIATEFQARFG